jgi:hypothetical protein
MSILDLDSYLAGLFDGEGCISARFEKTSTGRKNTRLIISVGMYSRAPVELFKQRFGGGFNKSGKRWSWWVCGITAKESLEVFSKLCILKSEQAKLGLLLIKEIEKTPISRNNHPKGTQIITSESMASRQNIINLLSTAKLKQYVDV